MKRKNVIPSFVLAGIFTSFAVLIAYLSKEDATASVMVGFFAAACLIDAIEGIRINLKIHRHYKYLTGGITYKHDIFREK